jgi:nickel/cobalt transporter (NiCoT) family protein
VQFRRGTAAVIGQVLEHIESHCGQHLRDLKAGRPFETATSRKPEDLPADFLIQRFGVRRSAGPVMLKEIAVSYQHVSNGRLRSRIVAVFTLLIAINVGVWAMALALFWHYPATLSLCLLAYGFGLRHAVDADHIAAIDNVTRKLMQEKKWPVTVGFFFSLGHSTVVLLMCFLMALGAGFVKTHFPEFHEMGSVVSTSVSAGFLLIIAAINFVIFLEVYKAFRAAKAGKIYSEDALQELLNGRGLLARILRPLFRFVSTSWHMYPVGFLFGLGFDTSTEVALLGIAATQAAQQLPLWSIMVFPLLFTAGMSLIDTTDGVVMLGAYGWAVVKPMRKLFYNMTITGVSFLIAVVIGSLEALSMIAATWHHEGGVWSLVNDLSENSAMLGYAIIAVLVVSWIASMVFYRIAELDRFDRPAAAVVPLGEALPIVGENVGTSGERFRE